MAAQDVPRLDKFRLLREFRHALEVEHHRRITEKARAAPDLLGEVALERGVTQQPRADYHDGEDRALHEIARHPRTDPARGAFEAYRLTPNRPLRNAFAGGRRPSDCHLALVRLTLPSQPERPIMLRYSQEGTGNTEESRATGIAASGMRPLAPTDGG